MKAYTVCLSILSADH